MAIDDMCVRVPWCACVFARDREGLGSGRGTERWRGDEEEITSVHIAKVWGSRVEAPVRRVRLSSALVAVID